MKRIEIIIFKGKTTHDNKIVRGSGCDSENNNKTYILDKMLMEYIMKLK